MNEARVIEGELVESAPLAVREQQAQHPAIFDTNDPVEVIDKAVRVADALKALVVKKRLVKNIQGKEYPLVEAWEVLAMMLRLTTVCEWTRRTEDGDGWEARIVVHDSAGNTIGSAENQCTKSERTWSSRDDYALRSMAQTRAKAKALRSVLGFVMSLAGYEATPAEEMPAQPPSEPVPGPAEKYAMTPGQLADYHGACQVLGLDEKGRHDLNELLTRKRSSKDFSRDDVAKVLRELSRRVDAQNKRAQMGSQAVP